MKIHEEGSFLPNYLRVSCQSNAPSSLDTNAYMSMHFPQTRTLKASLLHNHSTTNEVREMTFVHYYHLIFKVHLSLASCLDYIYDGTSIQLESYIAFIYLFILVLQTFIYLFIYLDTINVHLLLYLFFF